MSKSPIIAQGTIADIKAKLGVSVLNLNTAQDTDGNNTNWMRHWDNTNRVAVSIHKETVAEIKASPLVSLGLQSETRTSSQGEYTAYRIVKFTPAEEQL